MSPSFFYRKQKLVRICLPLLAAVFLFYISCNEGRLARDTKEEFESGYITYKLHWYTTTNGIESVISSLLPTELRMYISKPYLRMEMASLGGVGSAVFLINTKKGEGYVLVSVVGVRSSYHEVIAKDRESFLFSSTRTTPATSEVRDTIFMGEACKYTTAYVGNDHENGYQMIYAPRIGWEQINRYSPFESINGVVLSGTFRLGKLSVAMEATEIVACSVDSKLFQVESGYKEISRSAMEQLLGFGF